MSEPELFEHLKGVFFEEAGEGISTLENGLMALDEGKADDETLNSVFRAAHSIKGSAGGFGFDAIVKLTHALESLLDEMRSGSRPVTPAVVDPLLRSVDQLRALLSEAAGEGEADHAASDKLIEELTHLSSETDTGAQETAIEGSRCLLIDFRPHADFLSARSDPALILEELASLGELTTKVIVDRVPPLEDLNPDHLHLAWELVLETSSELARVKEVFEWVDEQCDVRISTLTELWDEDSPAALPAKAPPSAEIPKPSPAEKPPVASSAASIRVGIDKIDALMDIVGELVITQSMLCQIEREVDMSGLAHLSDGLAELSRQTRELQESVMRVRMVPIGAVFSRFPRLVRDVRASLGKEVDLELAGESTEIDKTVSEQLSDPLTHLVRNALDHGLEGPEDRVDAGKDSTGKLKLSARHEGGNVVIEISDDGRGIDADRVVTKARSRGLLGPDERPQDDRIYELLFLPGFSTADKVSALSGRGVGLDVVAKNIRNLGGSISTTSEPGHGTRFTIRIPMTLSILDAQLVRLVDQVYVIPLLSIIESVLVRPADFGRVAGGQEIYRLRDEYLPVIRAAGVFGIPGGDADRTPRLLVVIEDQGRRVAMLVDDLLDQQQVVIKRLETNYHSIPGISGATILGDGKVAFIIDVSGFIGLAERSGKRPEPSSQEQTNEVRT